MTEIQPLHSLRPERFETPKLLKRLASASRQLAELKGVAASIPHPGILINTLGLQEARILAGDVGSPVVTEDR